MLRKLVAIATLTAAVTLTAASPAAAASCTNLTQTSTGNTGLLNGTTIAAPINLDLGVTGNALSILGLATASTTGDDTATC